MNTQQLTTELAVQAMPADLQDGAYSAATTLPRARFGGTPMPNRFLHCSIFNAANLTSTARDQDRVAYLPLSSGGCIEYSGPELRQDDETVLLHIMHKLAGFAPDCPVTFDPKELCVQMGWTKERKNANTDRLRASLGRMQAVKLTCYDNELNERWSTGLVWKLAINDNGTWTVRMTDELLAAYGAHPAYINMKVRQQLPEGLATWLYGFVSSHNCLLDFKVEDLHQWSGSRLTDGREFKRAVRNAMRQIEALTGYGWAIADNKLAVFKQRNGQQVAH